MNRTTPTASLVNDIGSLSIPNDGRWGSVDAIVVRVSVTFYCAIRRAVRRRAGIGLGGMDDQEEIDFHIRLEFPPAGGLSFPADAEEMVPLEHRAAIPPESGDDFHLEHGASPEETAREFWAQGGHFVEDDEDPRRAAWLRIVTAALTVVAATLVVGAVLVLTGKPANSPHVAARFVATTTTSTVPPTTVPPTTTTVLPAVKAAVPSTPQTTVPPRKRSVTTTPTTQPTVTAPQTSGTLPVASTTTTTTSTSTTTTSTSTTTTTSTSTTTTTNPSIFGLGTP